MQVKIIAICLLSVGIMTHHHHHHTRLLDSSGFNANSAVDSKTQTAGVAGSYGNGYSGLTANQGSINAAAAGTQGSTLGTAYSQDSKSWAVNNGFNNVGGNILNSGSSNGFNNNSANNVSTVSQTGATAYGAGAAQSTTGVNGASVLAQGTNGTQTALSWGQNQQAWNVANGFVNKRLLGDRVVKGHTKSDSCEDNFGWNKDYSDKSVTNSAGTSQSFGDGYSSISAGRKGVGTEAYGKEGAKSSSALEQQNNAWNTENGFNNVGGAHTGFNNNYATNNATKAFTNAQGFGEAGVKSDVNKDTANVFSKGTKGTANELGWKGAEDNWAVTNGFGKKRRLNVRDVDDKKKDIVVGKDDKSIVEALKKQINILTIEKLAAEKQAADLKLANDDLKKRCGGNKIGSAQ